MCNKKWSNVDKAHLVTSQNTETLIFKYINNETSSIKLEDRGWLYLCFILSVMLQMFNPKVTFYKIGIFLSCPPRAPSISSSLLPFATTSPALFSALALSSFIMTFFFYDWRSKNSADYVWISNAVLFYFLLVWIFVAFMQKLHFNTSW